ncbi:hypothetical protein CP533_0084 [Ophiocordyceps camponoti-saundersi (nom. inval.)]|nr:hypothetical protein CP533_0084 [Ophiocordyceps camponoti-saundersi (nom. inval.)]
MLFGATRVASNESFEFDGQYSLQLSYGVVSRLAAGSGR